MLCSPYCSCVLRIREIGEDELPELVDGRARRACRASTPTRRPASSTGARQAGEMVWLLAERDGETVGAGYALVGWHTPPHRAIGAALVAARAPRRGRRRSRSLDALEGWAAEHGAPSSKARVARTTRAASPGRRAAATHESRTQLAARARPDASRERPSRRRRRGSRSSRGPSGPSSPQGSGRSHARRRPDIPGEEEDDVGTLEEWLERDMRGASDDPSAVFVALEDGEVVGYAKLSLLGGEHGARLPRPHRRQARAPWPRDRRRAQAHADRLGEGARLHVAPDLERGAERADPPPERAARLRARAGRRDRPRRSRRT